jgi:hypothetical protein
LIRFQPGGEGCLIELDQALLKPFCGKETRIYELGKPSENREIPEEGFYVGSLNATTARGCAVLPRRVVHLIKNSQDHLELVAVGVESMIPVDFYWMLLKAGKWALGKNAPDFEILGYDHDFNLLEQAIAPLMPMLLFVLEMRVKGSRGLVKVTLPSSIVDSAYPAENSL